MHLPSNDYNMIVCFWDCWEHDKKSANILSFEMLLLSGLRLVWTQQTPCISSKRPYKIMTWNFALCCGSSPLEVSTTGGHYLDFGGQGPKAQQRVHRLLERMVLRVDSEAGLVPKSWNFGSVSEYTIWCTSVRPVAIAAILEIFLHAFLAIWCDYAIHASTGLR